MQQRQCDRNWRRPAPTMRPAQPDITRRLGDYAAGYADRQAERAG